MAEDNLISLDLAINVLLDFLVEKLPYGYFRWLDEKDYEDINDYATIYKKDTEDAGFTFIKMTKRPFGFHCETRGEKFQVYCNSKEMGIKRLTE